MPNGGLSDQEEARVLKWYFRGEAITPAPVLYVALATAEPADDGSNIAAIECNYTNYARQLINSNTSDWQDAAGTDPTFVANNVEIQFPVSGSGPQTATHWMLLDHISNQLSTNLIHSGEIVQPPAGLVINVGTEPQFDIGALRCQMRGDVPA